MIRLSGVAVLACLSFAAHAADTHRSEAEMLTSQGQLFPLNNAREIGAQDLRDGIFSLLRNDEQRVLRADSIADLRSLDVDNFIVQDDAIIFLSGYSAAGDHDGAFYRYDAGSTAGDNAGTVIRPTAGTGRWLLIPMPDGYYDARWFGVVADNSTDNAAALDRIETADVRVQFPAGTILTTAVFLPERGFRGAGQDATVLKADSSWAAGDYFIDLKNLDTNSQRFEDIRLDGNNEMKYVVSTTDLDHSEGGNAGFHIWEHVKFFGASSGGYLFYFPDTVSSSGMETVGNVCISCFFNGNNGAGMIYLGVASDDMTFINTRLEHFNTPTVHPVRIHGSDISFINTFYSVGSDLGAGIFSLFRVTSAGSQRNFENMLIEPINALTATNFSHIFTCNLSCNMSINGMFLEGGGPTMPSTASIVLLSNIGASVGRLDIRNINSTLDSVNMTNLLSFDTDDGGSEHEITFSNVDEQYTNFIRVVPGSETTTAPAAHLVGSANGIGWNHSMEYDGTNIIFRGREPTIIAKDDVDLIAANADVARIVCPFDAYIQEIRTVLNAALATGDATVTAAVTGAGNVTGGVVTITQSGSAAGDIDSASPTYASNDNECDAGDEVTLTVGGSSTAGTGNVQVYFSPRAA